jgi:hypothetical protein
VVAVPFDPPYHPEVRGEDIPLLDSRMEARMKKAIETRLTNVIYQERQRLYP